MMVFKSQEVIISEEAGIISVRPRMRAALVIFFLGAVLGGGFILLSMALSEALPALSAFARWGGAVIAGVSVLVLPAGLFAQASRRVTLDSATGVIRKGKKTFDRSEVSDITVKSSLLLSQEVLTITAAARTGELILVSGHTPGHRSGMEKAAAQMKALMLGAAPPKAADVGTAPAAQRAPSPSLRRIPGLIVTLVGVVISATGALMIPDLVLTRPPASFGVLFWPVGIWIAVPGLFMLTGIMDRGFLRGRALHGILIALWAVSYFIVCFRQLG